MNTVAVSILLYSRLSQGLTQRIGILDSGPSNTKHSLLFILYYHIYLFIIVRILLNWDLLINHARSAPAVSTSDLL